MREASRPFMLRHEFHPYARCLCFMIQGRYAVPGNRQRFINASEVASFLYCRRAWAFQREGAPSTREPERRAGTAYHVPHGEKVATGERTGALSRALLVIAIVLLLFGLAVAFL